MSALKMPTEHQEQKMFFSWCLSHADEYKGVNLIFAIPNGGNIDAIRGKNLKDEGLRAGVPDMFLPVAVGGHHGLFIEMKVRKGGKVSPKQKLWLKALQEQGFKAVVCEGFYQARKELIKYYENI
jgi:hypothetical protein